MTEPHAGRDPGCPARRGTLRDELFGPPHRSRGIQVRTIGFGLLLVASLAVPALEKTAEPAPALSLTFSGLFIVFLAELLHPALRRFAIALRFAGAVTAVVGVVLQFV